VAINLLGEFLDELPTLQCGEDGCNSCHAAFVRSCTLPFDGGQSWEGPEAETKPDHSPVFLDGFDDDYVSDPSADTVIPDLPLNDHVVALPAYPIHDE
jgi:hypothetical protein